MTTNRRQAACLRWGGFAVIATCFCIPLSTSLMELGSALVILFWLGSGRATILGRLLRRQPAAALAALLFLYFLVAVSYSPADWGAAVAILMKYRELLLLPLVLSLALGDQALIRRAENGFVAGAMVLMLISYAMGLGLIPSAKYGNSLLFHITHSFFMALLAYWTLQRAIDRPRHRLPWASAFLLATANLIFITPGRTGMFTFAVLLGFAALQRLNLKKRLAGCLVLILLIPAGFMLSTNVSSRVQQALQDIIHYEPGTSRSSLGMRLDWWGNSIELIKERPLFGHGTGAFAVRQQELIAGGATMPSDNPHNEYLFIGVQLGLTGLALFLALLASQWVAAAGLERHRRFLLQGIVLTMATGCLMNSFLFDSHQGHFYAFLSALLLAAPPERPTTSVPAD
ncbi:O-antigen ligase family protein [Desulfoprunum benzoelyticum]|uniref:O-antigen ligase n=1 Tax=Desulfoprunum benzoelyticum TaxID=1506996 RepID=A0A840ULH1_9BACT|nr:O-antigen ligase family protein [Desulfoprunum benzoelyticum]MBB5346612.1 O-antigen ligase [Desulfoprunum benzoelyticum]MBM9529142.1 O-antigen ligase family protein [Desulfoprunum benzoelyticum]